MKKVNNNNRQKIELIKKYFIKDKFFQYLIYINIETKNANNM